MHFSSCETTIKPELCKALLNQTISTEENNSTIKAGRYAHSMKNILDKPKPTITIKKGIRVPNCSVYLNNVSVNSTITKHNKSISNVLIEPKEVNLKIINKEQITQPLIHNKQEQKINERNNNKNELSLLSTTHFNTNSNVYKTNKYFTPFIHDNQIIKTIEDQTIPIDKRDIPVTISNSKVEHKSHKHYRSSLSPNDKHTYSSKPTTITQHPKKKYGYECYIFSEAWFCF
jgi:CRISPR/Cas system-associated protein endoribonuclease Cas2